MRRLLLLSLVAVLVTALAAPVAAKKGEPTDLPFRGEFAGRLEFNTDSDDIEARCTAPAGKWVWAVTSSDGWGTATHMGKTHVYAEHCSYAGEGGPDGTYGQGMFTLTAANGDILTGTYDGGTSSMVGFRDDFMFTDDGTGRFTFASGGGVEIGSAELDFPAGGGPPVGGSFSLQMNGVISYSGR